MPVPRERLIPVAVYKERPNLSDIFIGGRRAIREALSFIGNEVNIAAGVVSVLEFSVKVGESLAPTGEVMPKMKCCSGSTEQPGDLKGI